MQFWYSFAADFGAVKSAASAANARIDTSAAAVGADA